MLDFPMGDLPVALTTALIAAIAMLVLGVAWQSVKALPLLARMLARLVLVGVVLVPFVLLILMTVHEKEREVAEAPASQPPASEAPRPKQKATPPSGGEGTATGARPPVVDDGIVTEKKAAEAKDPAREPARTKPAAPSAAAPGAAPPPEPSPAPAQPAPIAQPAPTDTPAPPATGPLETAPEGGSRGLPRGRVTTAPPPPPAPAAPAPAPAAPVPTSPALEPRTAAGEATQPDWDLVPVFYGTDRSQQPDPKRLQYNWERGRRLELGRALVTVPRAHQVPLVDRPWVVRIPYFQVKIYEEAEDPKRHFTMREIKALTREEFLAVVKERLKASERFKDHALIFVHGYNTSFDSAVYRTGQIAYDLKFDGAPFLYSWPSGGQVASYTYDRESAGQSEPYLRQFLELVVKETGAKSVSIIAHSMGNQPLLQVLRELKLSAPPGVEINQIISAAPDVDRDNFENIARAIQGLAKGVTLYAAANDRALNVSRRFHGGVPRAGDVPEHGPLVLPGIDTIDVSAASTDSLGINHSGYAENNALLNDIALLLQTGERPPDKRIPILEKIKTERGEYWRYPGAPK